jgi:hypothetical protein
LKKSYSSNFPITERIVEGLGFVKSASAFTSSDIQQTLSLSHFEKKRLGSNVFNLSEVIVSSELTGKIDPNKWINKANIITPEFRKLDY